MALYGSWWFMFMAVHVHGGSWMFIYMVVHGSPCSCMVLVKNGSLWFMIMAF